MQNFHTWKMIYSRTKLYAKTGNVFHKKTIFIWTYSWLYVHLNIAYGKKSHVIQFFDEPKALWTTYYAFIWEFELA